MSYVNQTASLKTFGYVCDSLQDCGVALFCDSDLASDTTDCCKSTSGIILALAGPVTYFPFSFSAICKRASNSACEADVVAITLGLKQEGLPALAMWEALASAARPLTASRERLLVGGRWVAGLHPIVCKE